MRDKNLEVCQFVDVYRLTGTQILAIDSKPNIKMRTALVTDRTARVFRAFFLLFWVPGSFGPTLFPPEVSLLLPFFLFWPGLKACVGLFAYSSAGLDGRAAPNPV